MPIVLNSIQFIIQDMFLKKNDFEITDMDILKTYYCTTQNEDLDVSLTAGKGENPGIDLKTAVPGSVVDQPTSQN